MVDTFHQIPPYLSPHLKSHQQNYRKVQKKSPVEGNIEYLVRSTIGPLPPP
jgi:hypothetical protein